MNTTEGNKLIAEFMGVVSSENWYDGYELHKAGIPFNYGAMGNGTSELKFHSSWDWLMPVVERIVPPHGWTLSGIKFQSVVINSLQTANINKVYIEVVKFIQWYNEQK